MYKKSHLNNIGDICHLPEDRLNLLERNITLTVEERINQLQSALNFIEEMRTSIREMNEKTDFKILIQKLTQNNFDFILVGGFAAAAYGSSFVTYDLDVCAVLSPANIEKLREILADLHPQHRITMNKPSFLDFPESLDSINNLYLQTDAGVLDLLSNITGVGSFDELKKSAIEIKIFGEKCKVISIDDLIKAKLSLKRPKDLEVAEELKVIKSMILK